MATILRRDNGWIDIELYPDGAGVHFCVAPVWLPEGGVILGINGGMIHLDAMADVVFGMM